MVGDVLCAKRYNNTWFVINYAIRALSVYQSWIGYDTTWIKYDDEQEKNREERVFFIFQRTCMIKIDMALTIKE